MVAAFPRSRDVPILPEPPPAVVVAQWRADSGVVVTAAMCGTHDVIHRQAYAEHPGHIWREYLDALAGARCVFCDPLTRVAWHHGADDLDSDLDELDPETVP